MKCVTNRFHLLRTRDRAILLVLVIFYLLASSTPAQEPVFTDNVLAESHLLKHADPTYPPIAVAAHVRGDVVLQINIDKQGHVIAVKPLTGSPMLISAASDAVRVWIYKPFLVNDVPAVVTTTVTVHFQLPEGEQKNDQDFHRALEECNDLLRRNVSASQSIAACRQAAAAADDLTGPYYTDRRTAYVYYATALLRGQQAKEAVTAGEKAIAFSRKYHDESSIAYAVTGQAKAMSGDLAGADRDLETAEQSERKALHAASKSQQSIYTSTLKSLLKLHAQVLTALGKQADAQKKLDEANKL